MARIERAQHAPTATRKRSWLTRSRDPQNLTISERI
jgi:hypothetical protein